MNELPEDDKTQAQEETAEEQSVPETDASEEEAPVKAEDPSEAEPDTDTEKPSESEAPEKSSESEEKEKQEEKPEEKSSDPVEAPEKETPSKKDSSKKPAAKSKKRKKKTAKDYALEFLIKIVITALVVAALLVFVIGIHVNHGNSSYPMIKDGDLVITYKLGEVQNGQEIAYKKDGKIRFGRIVAREGDTVQITDEYLTVNGYGVVEDVVYPTTAERATISFPYIVPQGAVFVLNDYRPDAGDSRTYGAIPLSDVEGEVVLILRRRGI